MHRRPSAGNALHGLLLAVVQGALSPECFAQAPAGASSSDLPQILVFGDLERGAVISDTPPLVQFDPPEIETFGVASASDLLAELTAETQSSRGRADAPPVLLLNGRRISSDAEIRDIPAEAIERVEVFPEDVALRYGYAADQKVVNFVVQELSLIHIYYRPQRARDPRSLWPRLHRRRCV